MKSPSKKLLTVAEYALLILGCTVLLQGGFIAMVAGVVSVSLSSVCYGMKCERETEEKTEKRHLAFYDRMSAFLYEWECKNRREIEKSFEKLRKAENRLDPKDTTNRIAVEYARSQVRQLAKKMKFPALEKKPNKPSSK